jgi:translation elongation factor EF-1alpha
MPWFQGPSLFEAIESLEPKEQLNDGKTRVSIIKIEGRRRSRPVERQNLILTGKIISGTLSVDQELALQVAGTASQVESIYSFGKSVT